MLVHRNALVGQRVDARDLGRESGVELVAERQSMRLGHGQHGVWIAGEIQSRRRSSPMPRVAHCRLTSRQLLLQFAQLGQGQRARLGLAGFPAQNRERRNVQALGKLLLRQPEALAQLANVRKVPRLMRVAHEAHITGGGGFVSTTYQLIEAQAAPRRAATR